jgi:hypothetical protein
VVRRLARWVVRAHHQVLHVVHAGAFESRGGGERGC